VDVASADGTTTVTGLTLSIGGTTAGEGTLSGELGGAAFSFDLTGFTGDFDGTVAGDNEDLSFSIDVAHSTATAALTDSDGATVGTAKSLTSADDLTDVDVGDAGASFDLSGVDYAGGMNGETADLDVTTAGAAATTAYTATLGTGVTGATATTVTADGSFGLTDENGNKAVVSFGDTLAEGTAEYNVADQSLVFQIGANKGQTVSIGIQDVSSDSLAVVANADVGSDLAGVTGFASLKNIDVRTSDGAQSAIVMIDAAIDQISTIRGDLGAFQANTLEANLDTLRVSTENLQASESIIRDADMASEMATFTKYQIMMQAGTAMLAQANQAPNNLLTLLRG
jgi:flagellin